MLGILLKWKVNYDFIRLGIYIGLPQVYKIDTWCDLKRQAILTLLMPIKCRLNEYNGSKGLSRRGLILI